MPTLFNVRLANPPSSFLALFCPQPDDYTSFWLCPYQRSYCLEIYSPPCWLSVNLFKFLHDKEVRLLITICIFLWAYASISWDNLKPYSPHLPNWSQLALHSCSGHVCASACGVLLTHPQTGDLVVILQLRRPVWSLSCNDSINS